MNVLVLTRYDRLGASSRQRFLLFQERLAASGFKLRIEPLLPDDYIVRLYDRRPMPWLAIARGYVRRVWVLLTAPRDDIVWIEKEVLPWAPAWLERFLLGGRTQVVDFDDGWHLKYQGPMQTKLEALARSADAVIVANGELEVWAKELGCAHVEMIPTVVDAHHYPLRELPDGPFTIGWIGVPFTAAYLASVIEPLRRLSREGARLKLIGAPRGIELPGVACDVVPWSEDTEAAELEACHVGIMPLADPVWDRFKSGYKLIQYMAAGRAVVASPVGANLDIVAKAETGFFADTADEWYAALAGLRDDREMCRRLGAAGRQRCADRYSLDAVGDRVVSVFKLAAEHTRQSKRA